MSGGKGGGGTESPDRISSNSTIKVVDALCEGEIEGLVDGLKSVYYNQTPLENADGTRNYEVANFAVMPGNQYQDYLPGFGEVNSEITVGQELKFPSPLTRSITTSGLDAIKITVAVPRLVKYDEKGSASGTDVGWNIYLKVDNGLFVHQQFVAFNEKSTSGFEHQATIRVPTGYTSLQIRVARGTLDSTSDRLANGTNWKSYTEVIESKFAYPHLAVAGTEISAKAASGGVPSRIYYIKAIKIRIPANATVRSDGGIFYNGVWDGTFTTPIWCADPAWFLYHLLSNERFGAAVPDAILSKTKWDFYTASQWCAEGVSNGAGGIEPRFLLNIVLDRQYEAYDLIVQLCNVFNGIFYLLEGGFALSVDRPANPVAILTNDNAKFNYTSSSLRSRVTVAIVQFQDPDNFHQPDVEIVEDIQGVALYGYREQRLTAMGCSSRSQAHRYGRWYLYTNRLQSQALTATTGMLGTRLKPGEIVYVADRLKTTYDCGRIVRADSTIVVLDRVLTPQPATVYDLIVALPDGSIDRRPVLTPQGASPDWLSPATPYIIPPLADSIWLLVPQAATLTQYRVLAAIPQNDYQYELTLIQHSPTKYAEIEAGLVVTPTPITSVPRPPRPPRNLSGYLETTIDPATNAIAVILELAWDYPIDNAGNPDNYTTGYSLQYRRVDTLTWTTLSTTARSIALTGLDAVEYTAQVAAVNIFGDKSNYIAIPAPINIDPTINYCAQFGNFYSAIFVAVAGVC